MPVCPKGRDIPNMLDVQRQNADILVHAKTAHNGLPQKRLNKALCWIVLHVTPTTLSVKGLNWKWNELGQFWPAEPARYIVSIGHLNWSISYWASRHPMCIVPEISHEKHDIQPRCTPQSQQRKDWATITGISSTGSFRVVEQAWNVGKLSQALTVTHFCQTCLCSMWSKFSCQHVQIDGTNRW